MFRELQKILGLAYAVSLDQAFDQQVEYLFLFSLATVNVFIFTKKEAGRMLKPVYI